MYLLWVFVFQPGGGPAENATDVSPAVHGVRGVFGVSALLLLS